MDYRGISRILPKDGQNTKSYINEIDLANEERKEYFVPYSANYLKYSDAVKNTLKNEGKELKDARINYYTKNGVGQLTLEYNVLAGEDITPQRLVLAIGEINEGAETTRGDAQEIMKRLLLTAKNYSQVEGFEIYVAKIQKLGWIVTNECIDIAGISRQDGEFDIKRTIFTQDERINITKKDIEQNQNSHFSRVEGQFSNTIEKYVIDGYKGLSVPKWNAKLEAKKKEVMEYAQSKKKGNVDKTKLLGVALSNMMPVAETEHNYIIERAYGKSINSYLEPLPDTGEIEKTYITTYLEIREEYLRTHDEKSKAKLLEFIEKVDRRTEFQRGDKRRELRERVAAVIGNVKEYQEEDIETERKLGEEEKAELLRQARKKTGPSAEDEIEI